MAIVSDRLDQIAAALAELGAGDPADLRRALREYDVRDIIAVLANNLANTGNGGGGGNGQPVLRAFPFAWDTPDLLTGAPIYTPTQGDWLLDAWIGQPIETPWDGTTPQGNLGLFLMAGPPNPLLSSAVDMTVAEDASNYGVGNLPTADALGGASGATIPGRFATDDPVCVIVNQTGNFAGAAFAFTNTFNNTLSLLPITVTAGANDQFVYTGDGGGGTPETFTIAPGTYTTLAQAAAAWNAAIGETAERFDTLVDVVALTDTSGDMRFTAKIEGTSENGNTITAGAHDAAEDFGVIAAGQSPAFTATFADGNDIDPGSSQGEAVVYLLTITPTAS